MGLAFCAPADIGSVWHSLDFDGLRRHSHFLLSATPAKEEFRIQNSDLDEDSLEDGHEGFLRGGNEEGGAGPAQSRIQNSGYKAAQ